ncbi:hypothetical protein PFISCL1PPCAC_1613 [Pristionchus fissidentatus]|uniref:Uncharacterized protein n=1 Tax=Pristionchus fissidentatus TaxID=1538716 RepID=A0AAV5UT99_9BILA|nr:hypothetical protein PFISCL1PPCAC_1613 [Pristionchus fissidentatus]
MRSVNLLLLYSLISIVSSARRVKRQGLFGESYPSFYQGPPRSSTDVKPRNDILNGSPKWGNEGINNGQSSKSDLSHEILHLPTPIDTTPVNIASKGVSPSPLSIAIPSNPFTKAALSFFDGSLLRDVLALG